MKYANYISGACLVFVLIVLFGSGVAEAATAQEIVDSVIDELNNVSDYTATLAADYDNSELDDMTGGSLQWKRNSTTWKTKIVSGSPYTCTYKCDGTVWNMLDSDDPVGTTVVAAKAHGDTYTRFNFAFDMFNMENILDNETWTKDDNTATVNSVVCYRVYTTKDDTNYEVWIDEATMKKVIRVKATDEDDDLEWQLDYSNYSNVENTAQLAGTIVTKHYANDTLGLTTTYTFSSVNINEGLANSIFTCEQMP